MVDDYSVTWDDVKVRLEKELQRRGISGADKIPMGVIEVALKKVWNDFCDEWIFGVQIRHGLRTGENEAAYLHECDGGGRGTADG